MKTIAIASYKGGTGKTITAINLAYNLSAIYGKKVLAIDCDPQGNLSYVLGRNMELKEGVYEFLNRERPFLKCVQKSIYRGISLMPAKSNLETLHLHSADAFGKTEEMKAYDYLIIDCHPSMQPVTIAALCAADSVVVPIKADRFSANGLEMMQDYIGQIREYNPGIDFMGCLFTMYSGRRSQREIIREIAVNTKYPVFKTVIADSEAANSSIDRRKALIPHRRLAAATRDYIDFTKELLEREG